MGLRYLALAGLLGFLALVVPNSSEARENYDVGIALSKTCMIMHQNNMSSNCPTYEEVLAVFPDTTNHDISGGFGYVDGVYQREQPQFKKHYGFYNFHHDIQWIDPPNDVRNTIAMITIENKLSDYTIPESYKMGDNYTQTLGHSRYIDKHCWRASVTADNWLLLVGDTIKHLKAGCTPDSTNFDHIKHIKHEKTVHDISTSYAWKLAVWLNEVKQMCKELCSQY